MAESGPAPIRDKIDVAHANAFLATLGFEPVADIGTPLPAFAHRAFFWTPKPEAALGASGHGGWGIDLPDHDLPIQSTAGGSLRQHGPLLAGVLAEKSSRVQSVTRKTGRSGVLSFVTLRHEIKQRAHPVLTEDQTLVLRANRDIAQVQTVTDEADARKALKLTSVTLFRYSALTFDAHRVHYDADYARDLGYSAPVVQVTLMATALAAWAVEQGHRSTNFSYRAEAPLFLGDVAWLCRAGAQYWIEGPKRRLCMTAEAG